ncbi:MAG TPA: hypothetical protein VIV60_08790 [Polyangiaceae bacterium]
MSLEPLAFVVLVMGLLASDAWLLYFQVGLCLFGATSALALPALGGATITPASLLLPFFVLRTYLRSGWSWMSTATPRAVIWLGVLVLWALVSAVLLPRAFAGTTQILTVDRTTSELKVMLFDLRPVSGNITQTAYLVGDFFVFLAARSILIDSARMKWFSNAVLWLATLNIAAAVLNLAEFWLRLPSVLAYVRNANYAVFEAYEEAGLVRIQGTFGETSAFSAFTLPLFAFTMQCWLNGWRPRFSGSVALISFVLLLSSTSGTAYTGLALYSLCLGVALMRRWLLGDLPRPTALILVLAILAIGICTVVAFAPAIVQRISEFFEYTVLNKLTSDSGLERSSWNRQAWQNFLDTYGVGVGLGSARASSFLLVLLSNLGVIGALTFIGFASEVLRNRESPDAYIGNASRHAALAALIVAGIADTVFDLGILFYLFAAAASATASEPIDSTVGNQSSEFFTWVPSLTRGPSLRGNRQA